MDLRERILSKLDEWAGEEEGASPGPWFTYLEGRWVGRTRETREDGAWRVPGFSVVSFDEASTVADGRFIASSRTVRPLLIKALRGEVERHYVAFDVSHTEPLDDAECSCRRAWPCPTLREIARNLGVE